MNIIDFVESEYVLGERLSPVQRVVLKALYGVPLDPKRKTITIHDRWARSMTEADYLRYLHDEGRSSIREVEYGHEFQEACLVFGRRSGKSYLQTLCSAYEMDRPLSNEGDTPHVQTISMTKDQACMVLGEVVSRVSKTLLGRKRQAVTTQSHVSYRSIDGKLVTDFHSQSSRAKALRGTHRRLVTLDEFAHFEEARDVLYAVAPGTNKLFIFTSPPLKGMGSCPFIQDYKNRKGQHLFMQIPTWELNPNISPDVLEGALSRSPESFAQEYGAEIP